MSYIHIGGSIPPTGIMKKSILSFVTAFFIFMMGIINYPVFSYAFALNSDNPVFVNGSNYIVSYKGNNNNPVTFNLSSSSDVVYALMCRPNNTPAYADNRVILFFSNNQFRYTYSGNYIGNGSGTQNSNMPFYWGIYSNDLGNLYLSDYKLESTTFPYYDMTTSEILGLLKNGGGVGVIVKDDLGYLKNVGYHVDSYGLENNPVGTNELISWDAQSTTGVDLTQSKYSVEFAMRDNSYQYRRTYSDIATQDTTTTQDLFQSDINSGFAYAMDFVTFLGSYVYPSGSNERNLMQGRAVKAGSNGKSIGLGTFPARNRKASFNAFSKYSIYANSSGDTDFKNYIDRVIGSATRHDYYENAKNFYNLTGPNYYGYGISYDIMARIVDTSNGNKGDWLLINKHNTPYIQSDTQDRLAGAVTVQPSIINNFNPQVDVVVDVPDIQIDNDIDFRPIIKVGYVQAQPNVTIEEGDIITINNNYEYTYEGDNIYNDIKDITNIYDDGDGGDGSGDVSDPDNPLGGIKQGLIIAKKFIRHLISWFRKIFNPFLPIWAQNVVIIALPITLFGIVWKMVKPLLSLLGREILPLLIEFFSGIPIPRLPGS